MSTSNSVTAGPQNSGQAYAPPAYPFRRLMAWCVRRELWENRSITIAPFAAAGLMIFAILMLVTKLMANAAAIGGSVGGNVHPIPMWIPYMLIAAPIIAVGLIVAAAYCLGALQGERRDRSILFWKSLPVSDLTIVLSKAAIPIVVIPLVTFAAAMIAQLVIFAIVMSVVPMFGAQANLVWGGMHVGADTVRMLWAGTPILYLTFGMLYGLLATALWHAPIFAWLLLVGGWARRMTFLWAIAPVMALEIIERIVFGTTWLESIIASRVYGSLSLAFAQVSDDSLPSFTPGHFLTAPGLWLGFAVAALFLGAAVFLRRYRQPI